LRKSHFCQSLYQIQNDDQNTDGVDRFQSFTVVFSSCVTLHFIW